MFFRNKKPKRLYIPTQSRWYTRPRQQRRPTVSRRQGIDVKGLLIRFFKERALAACLLVFVLVLVAILGSTSYLAVRGIQVARQDFNVDSASIENELNIYKGKNILFLPKYRVEQTIRERFPEFRSIDISKEFPDTLKITLVNHDIVANLRAYYVLPEPKEAVPEESSALNQAIAELNQEAGAPSPVPQPAGPLEDEKTRLAAFSLDAAARQKELEPKPVEQKSLLNYIGQAIFDQPENLELIVIAVRGLTQPVEDRQQVIALEHMEYIRDTLRYFADNFNREVEGLEYHPVAREIHIKIKKGPVVWLAIEKDYKEQLDKLKIIYEPAELDKENLAYIDLRVREKVIYCPRSAACAR